MWEYKSEATAHALELLLNDRAADGWEPVSITVSEWRYIGGRRWVTNVYTVVFRRATSADTIKQTVAVAYKPDGTRVELPIKVTY